MVADAPFVDPSPGDRPVTMRVVVCDDDSVVRSVISDLVEGRGGEVIAETDAAGDAIALAERFEPDVIVLDLGLGLGSGDDVLHHFAGRADAPAIIVFTAFDGVVDSPAATEIVRKPGFGQLERALDRVVQLRLRNDDRRRPTRALPTPASRDEVGLDGTSEFYEILVDAEPGDVLVALSTDGLDPGRTAATLRRVLRSEDRLTRRRDWLVALLVGGGEAGPGAVTQRLTSAIPDVADRIRSSATGEAPAEAFIDLTG